MKQYALGSVERALGALQALADRPGARLTELSQMLDSSDTTVLRTLRVLERYGYIRRGRQGNGYFLGSRLAELGQAAVASLDVIDILKPTMIDLSRKFNVTAHVGMLRSGMVTVVDKNDPPHPLVRYSTLGSRMPLHATAAGKATLALLGYDRANELLPEDLEAYTYATILDRQKLMVEIEDVRRQGFSTESSEYQIGFSCVGTAFRCAEDIYTISLSGPQIDAGELFERGTVLSAITKEVVADQIAYAQTL